MGIIIPRIEVHEIQKKGWILLYGRRKVGKTFMVRNFIPYDHYFFVERAGPILREISAGFETLSYEAFKTLIYELIKGEFTIVVDEFQRLPEDFIEMLHFAKERKAKLILLGSSMRVVEKILSPRSPILGIVRPVRLDLIRPSDVIKMFDGIDEVVFFRDPWILQFYASDGSDGNVSEAVKAAMLNVRGLVGEAFLEEDRGLTETYEGILRALALGNVFPKDIASFLGKHSSEIKSFLRNLMDMGIVKRVKVYGKKRWVYKISSPIIDLFYYLDTKYGISDLSIESEVFEKVYAYKLPRYFEDFVRAALAEKYGGNEELMLSPEVDALITSGNRVVCCAEVKVKADSGDLKKLELKTARFDCEKVVVDGTNFKKILFQE